MKRQRLGWRIGGLTIGGLSWSALRGYTVKLASYHNPNHMCWLWSAYIDQCIADEKRAFRAFRIPGAQSRSILQLWSINITFVWQAEGRYRSPTHERQTGLASKFGIKL